MWVEALISRVSFTTNEELPRVPVPNQEGWVMKPEEKPDHVVYDLNEAAGDTAECLAA